MHAHPPEAHPTYEQRRAQAREERARRLAKEAAATTAFSARSANTNLKHQRRDDRRKELLRKVQDGGITKASAGKKRRRPQKKLVAAEDMDGMRDALPSFSDDEGDEWEGLSDEDEEGAAATKRRRRKVGGESGKIKMRSLKHRPGAMKRKRRMEGLEMERFGRNLAQLSANTKQSNESKKAGIEVDSGGGGAETKEKWAALRAFIGSTMEKKDMGSKS